MIKNPKFGPFLRASEARKKKQPQLHHFWGKKMFYEVNQRELNCLVLSG
jgi:hypothetical protein